MKQYDILELFYQRIDPHLFGSILTVSGPLDNQENSAAFFISKEIGDGEIVYGSVIHLLDKIVGLQLQLLNRLKAARDTRSLAPGILRHPGNDPSHASWEDMVGEYEEELLEDTVLLTAIYFRNLNEIFSGRFSNNDVPVYNREDKQVDVVKLGVLANNLIHHRYFVVRPPYIHVIASAKDELPSETTFDSKVNGVEFLQVVADIAGQIKIRDLIGVLRARLQAVSANSPSRDIIFLVQNLHSLSRVFAERLPRDDAAAIRDLLLREAERRDGERIAREFAKGRADPVRIEYRGGAPSFKLAPDLSRKRIKIHVTINDENDEIEVDHREFFTILTQAHGDEPLIERPGTVDTHVEPLPP